MPAGKVSFCVSAENARMGTYNGFEREEVEPGVMDDVFRDIGATLPLYMTTDDCVWTSTVIRACRLQSSSGSSALGSKLKSIVASIAAFGSD